MNIMSFEEFLLMCDTKNIHNIGVEFLHGLHDDPLFQLCKKQDVKISFKAAGFTKRTIYVIGIDKLKTINMNCEVEKVSYEIPVKETRYAIRNYHTEIITDFTIVSEALFHELELLQNRVRTLESNLHVIKQTGQYHENTKRSS